jgi:hypothetical protein
MPCTYCKIRIQSSTRHTKGGKRSGLLGRVLKRRVAESRSASSAGCGQFERRRTRTKRDGTVQTRQRKYSFRCCIIRPHVPVPCWFSAERASLTHLLVSTETGGVLIFLVSGHIENKRKEIEPLRIAWLICPLRFWIAEANWKTQNKKHQCVFPAHRLTFA